MKKQITLTILAALLLAPLFAQFTIDGQVKTETGFPVVDVEMISTPQIFTNTFGVYEIPNLASGNYTLTPTKDTDYVNGVTVCDLIDMRNHILGVQNLDSPYKIIAGDANSSNGISTLDLVLLQRLILGIETTLSTPSWVFVDPDLVFNDPTNPFGTPGVETYAEVELTEDVTKDFIAVKKGDVNNSAWGTYPINFQSDPDILFLQKETTTVAPQNGYVTSFKADSFTDVHGFQFTLSYDASKMEFVEMNSAVLSNGNFDINYFDVATGAVNVAWIDANVAGVTFPDGEEVFTATFNILEETNLGESLNFTSDHALISTVDGTGCYGEIEEQLPTSIATLSIFSELNLYPNPVTSDLNISLELEQSADATLRLTNLLGQQLWKKNYQGSYINDQINVADLRSGIYLLEIEVNGQRMTRKILKSNP